MSETPTNRTPEVVSLPDGACSVDTDVGRTVFAAPAPAPELLSAERLAEILVTANHADEGRIRTNDLVAAYSRDVPDLLAHIDGQAKQLRLMEIDVDYRRSFNSKIAIELAAAEARATEADAQVAMLKTEMAEQERELSYERQMRQQTEEAMVKLADRVKQQQGELAEQEAQSKQRGGQLFTALSCLAAMWNQYCPPPTGAFPYPGHCFMSAGEETEEVLGFWEMLRADETAIDPDCHWEEVPEKAKALQR